MLRTSRVLRGRESELRRACAVLHTGRSLDLLGSRGIGTSRFLQELGHRIEEQGWRTIRLRGVAALRETPYGSLFVAGFRFPHGIVPTLGQSIDEVLGTSQQRSVVIIDQSDWVDAASWSVIDALRSMHGTPIVRGIAQIGRAPRRREGGASPSSQPAITLELAGLDFEDLRLVLSDRLGGAVDPGTTARILVKSGGIVGLALRIVDAALENGRLSEVRGVWTVTGDLWDPTLRGVIDTLLIPLPAGLREAAETLSLSRKRRTAMLWQRSSAGTASRVSNSGACSALPQPIDSGSLQCSPRCWGSTFASSRLPCDGFGCRSASLAEPARRTAVAASSRVIGPRGGRPPQSTTWCMPDWFRNRSGTGPEALARTGNSCRMPGPRPASRERWRARTLQPLRLRPCCCTRFEGATPRTPRSW